MAEIKPIRGWRYNPELAANIDELTSPLFDVVSEKQRDKLYQHPYNSIHLSVPQGEQPAVHAATLLDAWKKKGILIQDVVPAIYVYYQYFSLRGSTKEYCRKGFICHIKAYDWPEKVVLRHESTIPSSVNDRTSLLEHTKLQASPTHGLYTDPTFELEQYMDESMLSPILETEDYQGVRDVLSVIHDYEVIKRFIEKLAPLQIILADGHHRYEGSLAYRKSQMAKNSQHTGSEGYNYHLMFLTNTESDDIRILPTHRLISRLPDFDAEAFPENLKNFFTITPIEDPYDIQDIILGKKWAFGLLLKDKAYKIRLKPEVFDQLVWKFPQQIKELDLTVLHYFVIEKGLGIPGKEQRKSPHIHFSRSFSECLTKVLQGEAQAALITKEVSMEEVKRVCQSGYTMPQKSTYFYPKVICGFVFSSIEPNEFEIFPCLGF